MSNELQVTENRQASSVVSFFDIEGFALMQRIATAFSSSALVPKQYQGKEGMPNCLIAIEMAQRMNASPLMVMQNLYVVHGNPSWSSKFLVATINTCGRYQTLRYETVGDNPNDKNYKCRAWTIEKSTGERLDGEWIDWGMVNSEGWATKAGSKWKTMPGQMFKYRASAFWCRAYAPELSMGLQTTEELHDTYETSRNESGTFVANIDPLLAAANARKEPKEVLGETINKETGVITEPKSYAEVMDLINKSVSTQDISSAMELISLVDDKFQQELRDVAEMKVNQIEASGQGSLI